jgi:hypothetical protein
MKKLSFAAVALLITVMSFGQGRTSFGIKAGVNLANIDDDLAPNNTDHKVGLHIGGLAHIHVSDHFAIQPELFYSVQGADYTLSTYDGKTSNGYIMLPVMLQFMTKGGLRFQAGPQVGYLTSSKFERDSDGVTTDLKETSNNIDFSASVGLGYLTKSGLGFDARYNHGFSNMYERSSGFEAQSRVIQLGLFYQFNR